MMRNYKLSPFLFIFAVTSLGFSCGSDAPEIKSASNTPTANAKPKVTEFERELKSLKTADFDYIFTFKRKDGEAFSSEDKKIFKEKTYRANRRTLAKDNKTLFVGTNYAIEDKDLSDLKKRFDYEDFSKPAAELKKKAEAKKAASKSNKSSNSK